MSKLEQQDDIVETTGGGVGLRDVPTEKPGLSNPKTSLKESALRYTADGPENLEPELEDDHEVELLELEDAASDTRSDVLQALGNQEIDSEYRDIRLFLIRTEALVPFSPKQREVIGNYMDKILDKIFLGPASHIDTSRVAADRKGRITQLRTFAQRIFEFIQGSGNDEQVIQQQRARAVVAAFLKYDNSSGAASIFFAGVNRELGIPLS